MTNFAENLRQIGKAYARRQKAPIDKGDDLAMFDDATRAAIQAERDKEQAALNECEVLEENWPALELWHECAGFWRYSPMGGVLGLDWPQLAAYFALTSDARAPEDWRRVRLIEAAWVAELNA